MKTTFFALAGLGILTLGCGNSSSTYKPVPTKEVPPATVATGEELSLFPLAVGNKWVYDLKATQLTQAGALPQAAEFTLEVKSVEDVSGGAKRATVEVFKGEVLQDRQIWRVDNTGIYQESMGLETPRRAEPAQVAVPFPLEKGKVVNWAGKAPTGVGTTMRDMTQEITVQEPEVVDTIQGPISAYRIDNRQVYKDEKGRDVITKTVAWWAPKIGLVRHKQDIQVVPTEGKPVNVQTQSMILKQHVVK